MTKIMFVSISAPKPKISMADGKRLVFEDGALTLDDSDKKHKEWIDELRDSIKNRPAIAQLIREVDFEKGAEIVRKHQEQLAAKTKAIGGALSSSHLAAVKLGADMAHLANNPDPEAAKTLAAAIQSGDLTPTVKSSEVVRNKEGFVATAGENALNNLLGNAKRG